MNDNLYTPGSPEHQRYRDEASLMSFAEAERRRQAAELHYRASEEDSYFWEESIGSSSKTSSLFRALRELPEALRVQRRRLLTFIGAVAIVGTLAAPAGAYAEQYRIQPGDNLSNIAQQHHLSLSQLLAQNPEQKVTPSVVYPHEILTINEAEVKKPDFHIVKIGESLSSVAYAHDMSIARLLKLNPQFQENPSLVHPGQKILLKKSAAIHKPASAKKSTKSLKYSVPQKSHDMKVRDSIAPATIKVKPAAKKSSADKTKSPDYKQFMPENWGAIVEKFDSHKASPKPANHTHKKDTVAPKPAPTVPIVEDYDADSFGLNIIMPQNWKEWAKEHPSEAKKVPAAAAKSKHKKAPKHTAEDFMAAIIAQESTGDPLAVNGRTGARGLTQIMPENWPAWCKQALGEVREQTAENQVKVSLYKMNEYHDAYNDWGAVAIAWFAGPSRAVQYMNGDRSVLAMSDGHWTVKQYVDHMQANIGKIDPHDIISGHEHKKVKKAKKKSKKHAHKHITKAAKLNPVFGFGHESKNVVGDVSPFLLSATAANETQTISLTTSRRHDHEHKYRPTKHQKHRHKSKIDTRTLAGIKWSWPVNKDQMISDCWRARGGQHSGIDIAAPRGLPVRAAAEGTIVLARNNTAPVSGFGNTVFIKHKGRGGKERFTLYAHLDSFDARVKDGAKVKRGEIIGRVGNTGHSRGYHLHFNVQSSPMPVGDAHSPGTRNPVNYLPNDKRPNLTNCKK